MTEGNFPSTDLFIETFQDLREALNPLNFMVSEDRSFFIFSCANLPSEIIGQFLQILDGIIYIGFVSQKRQEVHLQCSESLVVFEAFSLISYFLRITELLNDEVTRLPNSNFIEFQRRLTYYLGNIIKDFNENWYVQPSVLAVVIIVAYTFSLDLSGNDCLVQFFDQRYEKLRDTIPTQDREIYDRLFNSNSYEILASNIFGLANHVMDHQNLTPPQLQEHSHQNSHSAPNSEGPRSNLINSQAIKEVQINSKVTTHESPLAFEEARKFFEGWSRQQQQTVDSQSFLKFNEIFKNQENSHNGVIAQQTIQNLACDFIKEKRDKGKLFKTILNWLSSLSTLLQSEDRDLKMDQVEDKTKEIFETIRNELSSQSSSSMLDTKKIFFENTLVPRDQKTQLASQILNTGDQTSKSQVWNMIFKNLCEIPSDVLSYFKSLNENKSLLIQEVCNSSSQLRLFVRDLYKNHTNSEAYSKLGLKKISQTLDELYNRFRSQGPECEDQEFQSLMSKLESTEQRISFIKAIMSWPSSSSDTREIMQDNKIKEKVIELEDAIKLMNDPQHKVQRYQEQIKMMLEEGSLNKSLFKNHLQALEFNLGDGPIENIAQLDELFKKIVICEQIEKRFPNLLDSLMKQYDLIKQLYSNREALDQTQRMNMMLGSLIRCCGQEIVQFPSRISNRASVPAIEDVKELLNLLELGETEKRQAQRDIMISILKKEATAADLKSLVCNPWILKQPHIHHDAVSQFLNGGAHDTISNETLESILRCAKIAKHLVQFVNGIYDYLEQNNIENYQIHKIITQETELDLYNLTTENLSDLIHIRGFIQASVNLSKCQIKGFQGFFLHAAEKLTTERNLRSYESVFEELAGKEMIENLRNLFEKQKAQI